MNTAYELAQLVTSLKKEKEALLKLQKELVDVVERLLREEKAGEGFTFGLIEDAQAAMKLYESSCE